MASKAQKIRVGLFAVVSLALLALVLVVFGGVRFWAKQDKYRVLVDGSVYGLVEGAKVHLNGIRIGTVTDIELVPDDPQHVAVTLAVKEGAPIRTDTRAVLQMAGITGLKEIDLRGGTAAGQPLPPGSTIPQGEAMLEKLEKEVESIGERSRQLMDKANELVDNLKQLSDPAQYQAIVQSAQLTAQNLAEASAGLKEMVGENRTGLRNSIAAVEVTAKKASALLDTEVAGLLVNANGVVGRANGVVGQLEGMVRDNQGAVRAAVFDLRQASRSFKDLAREVRQKPSRLLFSKEPSERKMP